MTSGHKLLEDCAQKTTECLKLQMRSYVHFPLEVNMKHLSVYRLRKAALVAALVTSVVSSAMAEPVKLTDKQLDSVAAGAISTIQVNGGGNTPNGNANGVPSVSVNPVGKAPPGQN
jgi:hypothetical protein